jgi:hypothetical protein
MGKQILKGFAMLMLIIVTAFATAVVSANGQSSNRMVADIPFEFVVGDQSLPSGEYAVRAVTLQGDALMIKGTESKGAAIRLTNAITGHKSNDRGKLVFHRYGQRYFLAEVWSAGEKTGRQLLKSRQERAIERELASKPSRNELAQNTYELVEIAAVLR